MIWIVLVRTVGWALVVGLSGGLLARIAMRGIAEGTNGNPAFTLGATASIVMLFVVAALGSGIAGSLRWPLGLRVGISIASAALLVLSGVSIGAVEILAAKDRGLSLASWSLLTLLTVGIMITVFATPALAWTLGRRERVRHCDARERDLSLHTAPPAT